ncbi:TadE/TadG family type IV pilus assembly protein [Pararhizobium antarcticum]|uniref:TadE/TadG family type IV pilus assembly protein n=1 Tax=Pararhizobium antarcticum TaxID=1798805 RepID=UPI000A48465B|nr:TadE/TadG family type IV pilus assembly protein [Pararhizobium antarcticum]
MIDKRKEERPASALTSNSTRRGKGLFRRFFKERSGASAIEFSLLALPFFVIVFASLETFAAFTGEQLLTSATDTMARKIRTGEITFGQGRPSDKSEAEFRQMFCDEISIIMTCSGDEVNTASKLFIDVRSFANFSDIPASVPRVGNLPSGDLDTSGFKYAPGGPTTINIVRAYYRWSVTTDLVRPYVTNLRPAGSSMPNDYLMVATAAFKSENY